jgi:acylphosphatase
LLLVISGRAPASAQRGRFSDKLARLQEASGRPAGGMAAVEKRIARRYYVSGMVQGVGYRFFAQRVAARLELPGYVKNLRDGRVEAYVIGEPASLAEFRAELERGPSYASVSCVTENDAQLDDRYASRFSIEHDSW